MSSRAIWRPEPPIRFGLIGASAIAKKHVAALNRMPDATVAAVADLDLDRAVPLAETFGARPYRDYKEMLANEELDVVSVLTPSGSHARIAIDVARSGRHVVVEKPMSLQLEEADLQIRACAENKVRMFVVLQNRFSQPVMQVRQALDAGRFGKLVSGSVRLRWCRDQAYYDASPWRGTWARDGGVFCNQACHHLDLMLWMLGDVESVCAMKATRLVDIEAEDTGVAILRFTNGALGVIEATTAWRPKDLEGSFSLAGECGSVEIGGFVVDQLKHWQFAEEAPQDADVFERYGSNPDVFAWQHEQYLRDVTHALTTGEPALVEVTEGRRTVELINAIYESAETGREVNLRFRPNHSRLGKTVSAVV
ncbi:MAG: Gfo/Idh/MocA family oxidoreductase [Planctomycetota bacterium]